MPRPERHERGPRTLAVHAGEPRPPIHGAVATPIFQSSTFLVEEGRGYHDIHYMRLSNTPSHVAVAAKLAALEGTERALVTGSGMAAITSALLAHLKQGDHVLAQRCLYGGTLDFLTENARQLGIETTFVPLDDPGAWQGALRPTTRVLYVESITNPLVEVGLLEEAAAFARAQGLVSLIDNTFPSPMNFRPAALGYDVVLHSATKYLNGHSDVVAGVACGSAARIEEIHKQVNILGGSLDSFSCYLLQRGLKTLPLRVRAQNENALALAKALARNPAVASVRYPGLPEDPSHAQARRHFAGFGAIIAFVPRGGLEAARRFCAALAIPLHAVSLGGVETLVCRPAATSHAGIPAAERRALGIPDERIRISVGIEDEADLIEDFERALAAA
ncbi:MAG: PLP-dependent aspartate aminotransferase family protein [Planctomycetes bacterium]|nr:PLP-dependent aspartate aminotransferase family protein [Planctomycetota bacterium]